MKATTLEYTPEISAEGLEKEPENTKYLNVFDSSADLINNWYNTRYLDHKATVIENRIRKLNYIYDNGKCPIFGHGIELAFGFGESIHVLSNWYPEITLDALDFNKLFLKIIPFIKDLNPKQVKDVWIGDARWTGKPDNHYDFINSCSFFEHLPEKVYWDVIKECLRILKPGGLLCVYLDLGPNYGEHVRCVPVEQTREELKSLGFEAVTDYIYKKPLLS